MDSEGFELAPVSESPGVAGYWLSAGDLDQVTVGRLLPNISEQFQRRAYSDIRLEVADEPSQRSILFSSEADCLSGEWEGLHRLPHPLATLR